MDLTKLQSVAADQIRADLPEFREGDIITVNFTIQEGTKSRIQAFSGVVLKTQGSGISKNFVVRKISQGIGVERTFPLNSPLIDSIDIVQYSKVRRSKLYYMRDRVGKAATKVKKKNTFTKKK